MDEKRTGSIVNKTKCKLCSGSFMDHETRIRVLDGIAVHVCKDCIMRSNRRAHEKSILRRARHWRRVMKAVKWLRP